MVYNPAAKPGQIPTTSHGLVDQNQCQGLNINQNDFVIEEEHQIH